jgi:hypothetical protein
MLKQENNRRIADMSKRVGMIYKLMPQELKEL